MSTSAFGVAVQEEVEVQEGTITVSHAREHEVLGDGKQLNFDQK